MANDGGILITNVLYNQDIKFSVEDVDDVKQVLKDSNIRYTEKQEKIYAYLVNAKILVPENVEEQQYVDYKCNEIIYGNDMLHLTIIPTDACNFRCKYCYQDGPKHIMKEETIISIKKYLKKALKKYNGLFISWYGGEPLLATELVCDIMKYANDLCRSLKIPLYGQMTTNGYNLTVEVFEELQRYHILSYMITVDGTRDTHNYQRPHATDPDSYSVILNNLKSIRDRVQRKNFRIGIRVNISPEILPYLNDYIDVIGKEFGHDARFGLIWEWVKDWGGDRICSNYDLVMDSYDSTEYKQYLDCITEKGLQMDRGQAKSRLGSEMCVASRKNGFLINYDGKVYKCAMALFDPTLESVNCVGEIDSFGNMIIDDYKNSLWVGQGTLPEECGECGHYPECMGLICPLSMKIRNVFLCSHTLNKEQDYISRNKEKLGKFQTVDIK